MNERAFKAWLMNRITYLEMKISENSFVTWDEKMQAKGQLIALEGIREGFGNGSFD